jgi:hypothetical protein
MPSACTAVSVVTGCWSLASSGEFRAVAVAVDFRAVAVADDLDLPESAATTQFDMLFP